MIAAILALVSALGFGTADFIGGRNSSKTHEMVVIAASQVVGLVLVVVAALTLGGEPTALDLVYGVVGGQFGFFGLIFLYRGIARGDTAVVAPLSAVVGALIPVVVGVLTGSRPGLVTWLGVVVAVPAVALVSGVARLRNRTVTSEALTNGLLAGLGFGLLFAVFGQTSIESGVWPVAASRVGSVVVLAILIRMRGISAKGVSAIYLPILWIGVLDLLGNLGFVLGTQRGDLVLVTMLTSLYPAVTVVLARFVDDHPITRPQTIGLGLAVVAATLLGLG
ncbi:MAG: EamA family transporter [Acidimicrobiia bacterium]|nr:EamA family transporter [Acidimicrobiia bacterium]